MLNVLTQVDNYFIISPNVIDDNGEWVAFIPPFCLTRLFLWINSHVHSMRPDSFELIQPETTNFSIHSITWITHLFHYEQLPHLQICHLTLHLNILCAVFGGGCALLWIIGWIEFKNHILKTVMKGFMLF